MSIVSKAIKGSGLTQLRSSLSTSEGTTLTTVEKWTGPYDQLKIKQSSVQASAKSTQLDPAVANHGILTITLETTLPANSATYPTIRATFIEVIWQELRKPVETHSAFADLTSQQIADAKKVVADGVSIPDGLTIASELIAMLSRGTTEYSVGVPVVRRTRTRVSGAAGGGNAWFRDTPPVTVPGDWQFLKTADERRLDGKTYNQVEEWTGAQSWDSTLYP